MTRKATTGQCRAPLARTTPEQKCRHTCRIVAQQQLTQHLARAQAEGMEYDEERVKEQAEEALKGAALMNWVKANCKVELKPYVPQTAAGFEVAAQ
jgi:hypothetical protein